MGPRPAPRAAAPTAHARSMRARPAHQPAACATPASISRARIHAPAQAATAIVIMT